jgi:hypothetical protein
LLAEPSNLLGIQLTVINDFEVARETTQDTVRSDAKCSCSVYLEIFYDL